MGRPLADPGMGGGGSQCAILLRGRRRSQPKFSQYVARASELSRGYSRRSDLAAFYSPGELRESLNSRAIIALCRGSAPPVEARID
jgi:hypothetical protein